jgi:uncharacterized hydrophobic protein (TIGR00271 family)
LTADSATRYEVINNISNGVEFRGTNLWVLIFATLIASLGLNVNSTAVIIGAMCISPLMGPIIGFGLALGINDYSLMKKSLRNLGFMITVSMFASTAFFLISPISTAQSELLARTMPTLYDVLIAVFGGAAGIVAQTRKDRTSTVIPGVAIATALMPPLCTAGFGLATMQLKYFIGALYLFFINMVCIALVTYLFIRFLKYPRQVSSDPKTEKRVKLYMSITLAIVIIPSTIIALRLVRQTIFEANADRFVSTVFKYDNTRVLECHKTYSMGREPSVIEVVLLGEELSDNIVDNARLQMAAYDLEDTKLIVKQTTWSGDSQVDFASVQQSYSELLAERNEQISRLRTRLSGRDSLINHLTTRLEEFEGNTPDTLAFTSIANESFTITECVKEFSLSQHIVYNNSGNKTDTVVVCVVKSDSLSISERERITRWLQVRCNNDNVMLYVKE